MMGRSSASPEIIKDASESLAGSSAFVEMSGFTIAETGRDSIDELWFRGSFPPSLLGVNISSEPF